MKKILLDIDGVLVVTPSWKIVEQHADGFMEFDERATKNLAFIIDKMKAHIVLTTTHRIQYSIEKWKSILHARGIWVDSISKLNDVAILSGMADRATEIKEWVDKQIDDESFVIIDDDSSLNDLPAYIKERCVLTKPLIGLDDEATQKVLDILNK